MGCNCGGSGAQAKRSAPQAQPRPGDWVAEYPNGNTRVFTGASARQEAAYAALSAGGTYRQVSAPQEGAATA